MMCSVCAIYSFYVSIKLSHMKSPWFLGSMYSIPLVLMLSSLLSGSFLSHQHFRMKKNCYIYDKVTKYRKMGSRGEE